MTKEKFTAIAAVVAMLLGIGSFSISTFDDVSAASNMTFTEDTAGNYDGYDYELWKDSGTTSMTLTGGGSFTCQWSNINNALFRTGKKLGSTQTYTQLGNISVEYDCEYKPDGNSYLCVYGWTEDPLVEFYIVESWGSWRPPGATSKGTVNIDGGTYDIYQTTRVQQPSIQGIKTFEQYWSVRTSKKESGTISVSEHMKAWESMGMKMGKLYEVALCVEGYQSSGSANVKKHIISIGGNSTPGETTPPTDATQPPETTPPANGYYFHSTFDTTTNALDSWEGRGAAIVDISDTGYNNSKSASVTGRTASWNGVARTLSESTFVPGNSYSFSALLMQNSVASEDFRLTLQYRTPGSAEDSYATVAEGKGESGQWVLLENTSFTIPAGATNMILYAETADSTTSFFMDEAIGAVAGTANPAKPNVNTDTTTTATTTEPVIPRVKKGDINGDGKINAVDVTALKKFILGMPETFDVQAADMDGNNKLDIIDLTLILNLVIETSK